MHLKTLTPEKQMSKPGFRYYSPALARWLSRDAASEDDNVNVYRFVADDPINFVDYLGAWKTQRHRLLIQAGLLAAWQQAPSVSMSCRQHIRQDLETFNEDQDSWGRGGNVWKNERHYNRELNDDANVLDIEYAMYLINEESRFDQSLVSPSRENCQKGLKALGYLSHSWQDFYMHAIRRPAQGLSVSERWEAWTKTPPVTGDPYNTQKFWPSSWSFWGGGEHPGGIRKEPFKPSDPEFRPRLTAAKAQTAAKFKVLVPRWYAACRCYCP